jgi:hypothetical protein
MIHFRLSIVSKYFQHAVWLSCREILFFSEMPADRARYSTRRRLPLEQTLSRLRLFSPEARLTDLTIVNAEPIYLPEILENCAEIPTLTQLILETTLYFGNLGSVGVEEIPNIIVNHASWMSRLTRLRIKSSNMLRHLVGPMHGIDLLGPLSSVSCPMFLSRSLHPPQRHIHQIDASANRSNPSA